MKTARILLIAFTFCLAVASSQPVNAQTSAKKSAEMVSTQSFPFKAGGVIQLKDSFGQVFVEGWDQASVEITVIKATGKKYAPEDQAQGLKRLDRIKVTISEEPDGKLLVTTKFPSRNLFTRPFRGKTDLKLLYRIKAPRSSMLDIDHDMGVVSVAGITNDTRITSRIGEISLGLPEGTEYDIDARSKLGDVKSQFDAKSGRPYLLGAKAVNETKGNTPHFYLRVGIGQINIKKTAL